MADAIERRSHPILRPLMWAHFAFLFTLPFTAIVAAGFLLERSPMPTLLWGFVPGVVYSTALSASYRIPVSPLAAFALVVAVPAQIALNVALFGASPWAFVVEEALVEVGALAVGIGVAMFVYRPTGWFGATVGAVMIAGAALAYLPAVVAAYEGAHPAWYLLLVSAFLTSALFHVRLFSGAARAFVASAAPQHVELVYGDGWLARLLGGGSRETIGPVLDEDKTVVAILVFVGLYVLGGIAVCVAIEQWLGVSP